MWAFTKAREPLCLEGSRSTLLSVLKREVHRAQGPPLSSADILCPVV